MKTKKSRTILRSSFIAVGIVALLMVSLVTVLGLSQLEPTLYWRVTPQGLSFPGDRPPEASPCFWDQFGQLAGTDVGVWLEEDYAVDGVTVTVRVKRNEDNSFDFEVVGGLMEELYVKGGAGGPFLFYQYEPYLDDGTALNTQGAVSFDQGVHNGYIEGQNKYQDVSHLEFCLAAYEEPEEGYIAIIPDATNEVGDPHTFTITAVASQTAPTSWVITPTVSPTPDTQSDTCSLPNIAGDDKSASCTLTITNTDPGSFIAQAQASLIYDDSTVTVETNGVGANSGPATKTYVDLRISLTPLTGTNAVSDSHTITATVEENAGSGWQGVDGATVEFSLPNDTASTTFDGDDDDCITDESGTCSVSITGSTAGSVEIQGKTTVAVGGVEITRTTGTSANTNAGGSGNATKTYVDAELTLEPSAMNEVGDTHAFTATLTVNDEPAATETISFTLSGVGSFFDPEPVSCVTDSDGQCIVKIESGVAGTTTVTAAWNGLVGAVDSDLDDTAVKTWVDACIAIGPEHATNALDHEHIFTVTVKLDEGDGSGLRPKEGVTPTVTVDPAPTSFNDDDCANGTDVNGQCIVVMNSSFTGTFTANAIVTITVDGITMVRSTADNSGPTGSGPAEKTYEDIGSLKVIKVVDWNGRDPIDGQEFDICIKGPSYPGGDCKTFIYPNLLEQEWLNLIAGEYEITEQDPGGNWEIDIDPEVVTIYGDDDPVQATVTVTNTYDIVVGGATVASNQIRALTFLLAVIALMGLLASGAGLILWRRKLKQR